MNIIEHFKQNKNGRDYVVGDIHGMFTLLYQTLLNMGFDFKKDRLFSVGDLCDRGPDSAEILTWLAYPWFHPVMGNHEEIILYYEHGIYSASDLENVGAAWWLSYPAEKKALVVEKYKNLPLLIDVETSTGLVGIVHAECPHATWQKLPEALSGMTGHKMRNQCLWSTQSPLNDHIVQGVEAVIVGHMTQTDYMVNGNVHLIDTGAVYPQGHFTILELDTLAPVGTFE